MTDIVERLRDGSFSVDLCREAAAEIERLQHEKSQWQPIYQALDRDRARLRDEIERLREMLTKIWVAYQDDEGIRKIYRDAGRENDRERG